VLVRLSDDFEDAAPLIADLLSVPSGNRYPALELTPQKRKEKTYAALLAQLKGLAACEPVLMVFEDVHWIDPTSLELLDLIVDRVPTLPILLVITFRSEFAPSWIGRPHVTLLTLNRLPPSERAEMIAGVTGGKALPKDIVDQIIDRTDGVPLFIEELTKAVLESGILIETEDRYTAAAPVQPRPIPATLQASLLERLDRLHETREVVQIAAALGRSFSHEILESQFAETTENQPELLARHCTEVGLMEKAVDHWLKAGQQAVLRSANNEAVAQLRKGLDVLATLPDGPWRRQQELDLRIVLRTALGATKGYAAAEVGETIARARALAEQIDRPDYLVPLMYVQWQFHFVRAEHRLALSLAERIEKIGEARNEVAT
jgi:predicted ATPase